MTRPADYRIPLTAAPGHVYVSANSLAWNRATGEQGGTIALGPGRIASAQGGTVSLGPGRIASAQDSTVALRARRDRVHERRFSLRLRQQLHQAYRSSDEAERRLSIYRQWADDHVYLAFRLQDQERESR